MKRDVPGAFGLLFLRAVDLVRGRLGGQARPAAIDSGGNLINGDRPRVASELAIGAAQVMAGMAHDPGLLWASPLELEEELKDRETTSSLESRVGRHRCGPARSYPAHAPRWHQQRAAGAQLMIDHPNAPAQRDPISSDAAIRARAWR